MANIHILQNVAHGKEVPQQYAAFTSKVTALMLLDKCNAWVASRPKTPECDYYAEDCAECEAREAAWVKAHAEWVASAPLGPEVKMAWAFTVVSLPLDPKFGA